MRLAYTFVIHIYTILVRIAALFNPKAALWISGRKDGLDRLKKIAGNNDAWLWFHAASLGEFEQGRPVIEAIREKYPDFKILLTFFSPSGYELRKNYELAHCIAYLPADTLQNAKKLLELFHFKAVFFIKYEFWYNYMYQIGQKGVPLYFISAKFRPKQHFFSWYGGWFRKQLLNVSHFFVQDETSLELLKKIGITSASFTGDTRFDRVFRLARQASKFPIIEHFKGDGKIIIAGSTWPSDEKMLLPLVQQLPSNYKIVIAPHNVSEKHIASIEAQLIATHIRYTDYNSNDDYKVLIINNIGILSQLYQYAAFAYVGGGFGQAIHNIQEALTFGCPVIIGPKHKNFIEAVDLVASGGVFEVFDAVSMNSILSKLIIDETFRNEASAICRNYVARQIGATDMILKYLESDFETITDVG